MTMNSILKIISGGQTGVDRAGLDVAIQLGLPCGGWVPRGGLAEDHPDPPGLLAVYPDLIETASRTYPERTECNVVNSAATLIVQPRNLSSRGTALTIRLADKHQRPFLVCDGTDPQLVSRWLDRTWLTRPAGAVGLVLNVAGPRSSRWPEGYDRTRDLLYAVFGTR